MYVIVLVALILCILFKVLNVNNSPEKSLFYCANGKLLEQIMKSAPQLAEPYKPTRLWGFSGHIQTILQGVISRLSCPLVDGRRHFIKAADGATVSYDLYQSMGRSSDDLTIAIAPGICNSSESIYVRRVVYHAQFQGYRVAVLNHVGALKCVPVTSPRIFTGGNTGDYDCMVVDLLKRYPSTKIVCLGFSMGGNLVTKYLGERRHNSQIVAGISACQGYDALLASQMLLEWEGFRRLYMFVMTENLRGIIRRWQKELFPEYLKTQLGISERSVLGASTVIELDDVYTRKRLGFKSVEDMYRNWSSRNYWEKIEVPMVYINALDDPLIPPKMLEPVRQLAGNKQNSLYIEQKYGGHLGFYEGGIVNPNALTWLDRVVVDCATGLVAYTESGDAEKASKKSFSDHKDSGESQVTPLADDADTPLRRLTEKCRYNVRVSDLTPPSTGRLSEGPDNRTSDLKKEDGPSKEVAKTGEDIALGEADSNGGGMLSDLEPKSASDESTIRRRRLAPPCKKDTHYK